MTIYYIKDAYNFFPFFFQKGVDNSGISPKHDNFLLGAVPLRYSIPVSIMFQVDRVKLAEKQNQLHVDSKTPILSVTMLHCDYMVTEQ